MSPPAPSDAVAHELGTAGGGRLNFTDACCGHGRLLVTAAAEASPNAVDDGAVVGCALGAFDGVAFRMPPLVDADGAVFVGKPEVGARASLLRRAAASRLCRRQGIALDARDASRAYLIVDKDDETAAAELLVVRLG